MTTLGTIAGVLFVVLFLIGWVGGVCAGLYTVYHAILAGFKPSHQNKALAGIGTFRAFWLFGVRVWLFGVLLGLPGIVLALWLEGTISR